MPNPAYLAVHEAFFFYSFLVRNDIQAFLKEPLTQWGELTPRPLFDVDRVRQAAEQVLKVNDIRLFQPFGSHHTESEPDEETWERAGREWVAERRSRSNGQDDYLDVELELTPYKLILPDQHGPDSLDSSQHQALGRYKDHQRVVEALKDLLTESPMYVRQSVSQMTRRIILHRGGAAPLTGNAPIGSQPTRSRRLISFRNWTIHVRIGVPEPAFVWEIAMAAAFSFFKAFVVWAISMRFFSQALKFPSPDVRSWSWDELKFLLCNISVLAWWIWDVVGKIKKLKAARDRQRRTERDQERQRRLAEWRALGFIPDNEATNGHGDRVQLFHHQPQHDVPVAPADNNNNNANNNPMPPNRPHGAAAIANMNSLRPRSSERRPGTLLRIRDLFAGYGLPYDRRILRLFYLPQNSIHSPSNVRRPPVIPVTDHRVPNSDKNLPLAPPRPSAWWRYIGLPIYLCLMTLVPTWDEERIKVIKEREAHMKVLVEKLSEEHERVRTEHQRSPSVGQQDTTEPSGTLVRRDAPPDSDQLSDYFPDTSDGHQRARQEGHTPVQSPPPPTNDQPRSKPPPILPRGLCPEAIACYRRALNPSEQINWAEEMEAQRRMIPNQQ